MASKNWALSIVICGLLSLGLAFFVFNSAVFKHASELSHELTPPLRLIPARQELLFVRFVGDRKRLVSCARNGLITLWDLETGVAVCQVQDIGDIGDITASIRPVILATGGRDRRTCLWRIADDRITKLQELDHGEGDLVLLPTGRRLVIGLKRGFELLNLEIPNVERMFQAHDAFEHDEFAGGPIACSPDGTKIVATGWDSRILIWDLLKQKQIALFQGHSSGASRGITCVKFAPDGRTFATTGMDCRVKLWDSHAGNLIREFAGHPDPVFSLCFSHDGRMLATTTGYSFDLPGQIKIWDAKEGTELMSFHGHRKAILCCTFSPDDKSLVTGGLDGDLKIWDLSQLLDRPVP